MSQDLSCGCLSSSACEPCLWFSCSTTGAEVWAFLHILQQTVAKHPQMTPNTCVSGWGCPMLSAAGKMRLWSARNFSTASTASTAVTTPRRFPPGTARFAGFSSLLYWVPPRLREDASSGNMKFCQDKCQRTFSNPPTCVWRVVCCSRIVLRAETWSPLSFIYSVHSENVMSPWGVGGLINPCKVLPPQKELQQF